MKHNSASPPILSRQISLSLHRQNTASEALSLASISFDRRFSRIKTGSSWSLKSPLGSCLQKAKRAKKITTNDSAVRSEGANGTHANRYKSLKDSGENPE